ncbi:hypothetical protein D3C84_859090 [compost metagenome]
MSKSVIAHKAAKGAPLQSAPTEKETFDTSLKGVPVAMKARWQELKRQGRVYGSFTAFLLESATQRLDDLENR